MAFVPWPGFGPFESYEADHTVTGGEHPRTRRTDDRRPLHAGPQPRPRHVLDPRRGRALLTATCCSSGSVGRVDLPGGDWPTLIASIQSLLAEFPATRPPVYPGHMGVTTLGRERATNPFLRELAQR